ncbi:MAG: galactose oxidase-like domain-containing protein [Phycisphaerales bacterium]
MSIASRAILRLGGVSVALSLGAVASAGDDPAEVGLWLPPQPWEVIAIHAAVLPTGEVLHYSYPMDDSGSRARLWNPTTGEFTPVDLSTDIFCGGLSHLPNGSLLMTGGNNHNQLCPQVPQGRRVTHYFNPFAGTWTVGGLMADGRWYPANLALGDGRTVILSGINLTCGLNPMMEVFTPGVGIDIIPEGMRFLALYPRMHLLTSGKLVHVGQEDITYTFDFEALQWEFVDFSNFGWRGEGTSVLIPGRTDQVLAIGGDDFVNGVTNTCEIIDLSEANPQWRFTGSLNVARARGNAVILPDRKVVLIGGGQDGPYGHPINFAERFDPETETWGLLPAQGFSRMYHSTAVLLPDGRVLSAGQDEGESAFWGEIYVPWYLFRGPRPQIAAVPGRIGYDQPFSLATPEAGEITSVALIAPASTTHSVNSSQRYLGLEFEVTGDASLRLVGPLNGNHAPPGYYMLFILNGNDVPSVAPFVHVGPELLGDVDGNGIVGSGDLLILLATWGPCAGCQADLNGDGNVSAADLLILLVNWG